MSRAHLTALVATLAMGTMAPRLAAQDTSSATGQAQPDTSAYTGAGGVDTSARPGRVGADPMGGAAADTGAMRDTAASDSTRVGDPPPVVPRDSQPRLRPGSDTAIDTMSAPGRADRDSAGPLGATDSSGMRGRHPDTTKVGDTTSPAPGVTLPSDTDSASDSGGAGATGGRAADTSGMVQPTPQPGPSTSPSGP